jgi:hypothetical protein
MNLAMDHLYRALSELGKGIEELDDLWPVEEDLPPEASEKSEEEVADIGS